MLFTRKKWNIKEEVLEALDGQEVLVIGTKERTILNGNGGDIAETICHILDNLEGCSDAGFVDSILDAYLIAKGRKDIKETIKEGLEAIREARKGTEKDTPKKRGRKPKTEKKEEK